MSKKFYHAGKTPKECDGTCCYRPILMRDSTELDTLDIDQLPEIISTLPGEIGFNEWVIIGKDNHPQHINLCQGGNYRSVNPNKAIGDIIPEEDLRAMKFNEMKGNLYVVERAIRLIKVCSVEELIDQCQDRLNTSKIIVSK